MLILSRRVGERIVVDGPCVIEVCAVRSGNRVALGFEAPGTTTISREELVGRKLDQMVQRCQKIEELVCSS